MDRHLLLLAAALCLSLPAIAESGPFSLTFLGEERVMTQSSPGAQGNVYGFEGGTVAFLDGSFYVFPSEMIGDPKWVNMTLGAWEGSFSTPFVRKATLFSGTTNFNGSDVRAALWAPMPYFDGASQTWYLYYVSYRCAPNNASGFYGNFDGHIWSAVSTVPGEGGILGPYRDIGVVLKPDENSQIWEGLQGTDSISVPFQLPNGTLAAWYGSCHCESPPPAAYTPGRWNVGLATASGPGMPFVRSPSPAVNPVNLNQGFAENPVVTELRLADSRLLYTAVFDYISGEPQGFGLAFSQDGISWNATLVPIPSGARTPLKLFFFSSQSPTFTPITDVTTQGLPDRAAIFFSRVEGNYENVLYANFTIGWN